MSPMSLLVLPVETLRDAPELREPTSSCGERRERRLVAAVVTTLVVAGVLLSVWLH